jgi:hypothetical protein
MTACSKDEAVTQTVTVVIDSREAIEERFRLQPLGFASSRAFIHEHGDIGWWIVKADTAVSPTIIRYERSSPLAFSNYVLYAGGGRGGRGIAECSRVV